MATITSYSSGALKLTDYLIATDLSTENVTRNFPVSAVVNAILKALTIGTVTSVSTENSDFITLAGGPITITGSLTASLSVSGTPSSSTYLRGDGTWSEPGPTPTDIITLYNGNPLTNDTSQWKFTGTGVEASSINNNVVVNIPGLLSSVESVVNGVGITATGSTATNPSTGDVTVINSGVYQATAGGNVTLSGSATPLQYSSAVTINTTSNAGKIFTVNAGSGTTITNATTNPELDIDYVGLNNFILANTDIINSDDIIAFQDLSASEVKTAKLNTIPTSALTSIISTIDTADNGKIKNTESPAFTNVWGAKEIVTLTISEYNAICPGVDCDANTLYLIVGAGTTYIINLVYANWNSIVYSTGGVASQSDYSVTTEVDDGSGYVDVTGNPQLSGVTGTTYTFRTTINGLNGYTVSSVSGNTTTNTITGNATETQTVVATLTPPTTPQCIVTLSVQDSTTGPGAGNYSLSAITPSNPQTVNQGAQFNFYTTISANSGYYFNPSDPATTRDFSGTALPQANMTQTGYIDGEILQSVYSADLLFASGDNLTVSGGGNLTDAQLSYSASSVTPAGHDETIPAILVANDSFQWNNLTGVVGGTNYSGTITFSTNQDGSGGISPITGTVSGSIPSVGSNQQITVYAQGSITYNPTPPNNFVTMNWTSTSITDNTSSGYTLSPAQNTSSGNAAVGNTGWTIAPGTASVILLSGQYFSSGGTPVNSSNKWYSPALAMPATNAPNGTTSDWTVTGTVDWIPVTIEVTYSLNSNATYYVTFSGQTSKTFTVYNGSGAHTQASFLVSASNIVNFSLGRTGSTWCSPTPYSLHCLYPTYGCGSQYGCSAYVPEGDGSWQAELNGTVVNPYLQTWTKGNANLHIRSGQFAALSSSDTLTIDITEN